MISSSLYCFIIITLISLVKCQTLDGILNDILVDLSDANDFLENYVANQVIFGDQDKTTTISKRSASPVIRSYQTDFNEQKYERLNSNFSSHIEQFEDGDSRIFGSIRRYPQGSLLNLGPTLIIPFAPFGVIQFRFPIAVRVNYVIDRLNGVQSRKRRKRDLNFRRFNVIQQDQFDFYEWIDDVLTNTFAIDGKICTQRLICELAEAPIDKLSFIGKIIHQIFEPQIDRNAHDVLSDYVKAQLIGHRRIEKCSDIYRKCPLTIRTFLPKNYENYYDVLINNDI